MPSNVNDKLIDPMIDNAMRKVFAFVASGRRGASTAITTASDTQREVHNGVELWSTRKAAAMGT